MIRNILIGYPQTITTWHTSSPRTGALGPTSEGAGGLILSLCCGCVSLLFVFVSPPIGLCLSIGYGLPYRGILVHALQPSTCCVDLLSHWRYYPAIYPYSYAYSVYVALHIFTHFRLNFASIFYLFSIFFRHFSQCLQGFRNMGENNP